MTGTDTDIPVAHLCPLKHRGHAPTIDPPATMCHAHALQLRDRVADITRWWDDIDALASAAGSSGHGHGLNSKPPVRLDILALTDMHTRDGGDIPPAARILTSTANWIARARRLTPVASAAAALRLLRVHWVALGDHPDPRAVHDRVSWVWTYLSRLVGESRPPKALELPCDAPHPDPQVDGNCGGEVWSTGRRVGIMARCRDCGAEVTDTGVMLDVMQRHAAAQRFTGVRIPLTEAN